MYLNPRLRRFLALGLAFVLLVPPPVHAQEINLPDPGVRVSLSPAFNPPVLKGLKVHPDNPFRFDFILDKGDEDLLNSDLSSRDSGIRDKALKSQAQRLIKYFLASLTVPEKDLWVNLSPYEKDRIVPTSFGQTEMGRDLLAQDYLLKQITASLIYPEDAFGKKFWNRVYQQALKRYGTTNIPVNTFNKVWIVPEKAVVYENSKAGTAYVVESRLKVMLQEDYLALEKNVEGGHVGQAAATAADPNVSPQKDVNALGSQIVREIVIPQLTKEVNENKNFAQLRQVYNSLILATWYKKKVKDSILSQVYSDKNKVKGVEYSSSVIPAKAGIQNKGDVNGIYQQYLQAFKKGVYNYIKEEQDPVTQQMIPRKYFSGGITWGATYLNPAMTIVKNISDSAMAGNYKEIKAEFDMAKTNPLPNQSVDRAMTSTEELTINDALEIVEKLFTDSELESSWMLQRQGDQGNDFLIEPNREFMPGVWLPHFQQSIKQTGISPQEFRRELEQGTLNTDTINFIKAPILIDKAHKVSLNVEENGIDIVNVKQKLKERVRLLASNGSKQITICLGGTLFGEVQNTLELVERILREVANESGVTDVNDWIDSWQVKIRAISINTLYLYDIGRKLHASNSIVHKNWVQLEYMDLLDERQWLRLIQEPADMFLVSRSLYLGKWDNLTPEPRQNLLIKFINKAHQFVKQAGIFVTEIPRYYAPIPAGFEEIIMEGWRRTGVYIRSDKAQVANDLGGIDLTPANMNLQTKMDSRFRGNDSEGIKFHIDPAMLEQLQNAPGFVPVIINIQPMTDLWAFLEVS